MPDALPPPVPESDSAEPIVPPSVRRAWRYRLLAWLWCAVTPAALFLLVRERAWLTAPGIVSKLERIRFEQWIAFALVATHAWFAWQAWRSRSGVRGSGFGVRG